MKMCRMRVRDVCKGKKKKGKNEYSRHACVITRNAKNRKSTTEYEMLRCSIEHARQNEHSGIVPVAQLKSALGQQRNNISRAKKKSRPFDLFHFFFFYSILSFQRFRTIGVRLRRLPAHATFKFALNLSVS